MRDHVLGRRSFISRFRCGHDRPCLPSQIEISSLSDASEYSGLYRYDERSNFLKAGKVPFTEEDVNTNGWAPKSSTYQRGKHRGKRRAEVIHFVHNV